jgi:4-methylaminobutanoate oxidase (formaldehyde-forming)
MTTAARPIRIDPDKVDLHPLDLAPEDFPSPLPAQHHALLFEDKAIGLAVGIRDTTTMQEATTTAWIRHQTRAGADCHVTDGTSATTILSLQGPRSRDILAPMTGKDLSTEALPFPASRFLDIGPVPVHVVRVTCMGELGDGLHIPTEYSDVAHDALVEGIGAAGVDPWHCRLMALGSLRLEKGYRDFAIDVDTTDTPLQAGPGSVVDVTKPDFSGRDAGVAQKAAGPLTRRILPFRQDDPAPLLFGNEPIPCDGRNVGSIRAGAFGPTPGCPVGPGAISHAEGITADFLRSHRREIDMHDQRVPATPSLTSFNDPKSKRVHA